jgi:aspartate aminotransferase-like enzyme
MEELRIPGPTPCPPEVLQAMTKQMINHRGEEFQGMLMDVTDKLKQLFQTKNDLYLLTGSGTGGLEAAVVNTLSPGDRILSVSIGVFGDRFAAIAEEFGADVNRLAFEWGKAADPDEVRKALQADPKIKAVLATHNETSTGVTNDLASLCSVISEFDKLIIVDAISSLGSINLPVDEWQCDIVVTGSQKGWMVPPGLAMVSISEKAWKAHAEAKMPRFYWDFTKAKSYLERKQTPWTPAVPVVYGLYVSLDMMLKEGLQNIVARHARVGAAAREGVKSLGLPLFAQEGYSSNTVTSVAGSNGLDVKKMLTIMREEHNVILGGGQQKLDGKIFRIGHLGMVDEDDIAKVISALEVALPKAGFGGK